MTDTSRPTTPPPGPDWPTQATDAIVNLVDSAKEKVNGPANSAARAVVYGTLGAIVGTAALILFLVLLVRGIDILAQVVLDLVNAEKAGRSAWIAHLVTGLLLLVPGALVWRKAKRPVAA